MRCNELQRAAMGWKFSYIILHPCNGGYFASYVIKPTDLLNYDGDVSLFWWSNLNYR